jgi:hypothetical protein
MFADYEKAVFEGQPFNLLKMNDRLLKIIN